MRAWTLLACAALLLLPLGMAQPGCDAPRCDARQTPDEPHGKEWTPQDAAFRHIAFTLVDGHITQFTVDDKLVLDALSIRGAGPVEARHVGHALQLSGDGWAVRIQDNPTGLITARGNATLVFDFPTENITQQGRSWRVDYGHFGGLLAGAAQQRGDVLALAGEGRFHIRAETHDADDRGDKIVHKDVRRDVRVHVDAAIENRRVLADVKVRSDVEILQYEDVDVQVTRPDRATRDDPLRVRVEADLDTGKTLVVDVDPKLIENGSLEVRYFDLFDDGARTEIVFRQADSLTDVLDATDDGGQPEFWVVKDADGIQILVSVPHWSAHEITIASIGEFLLEPSVLVGIVAGIGGVAVAALLMMRPRRELT